MMTIFNWFNITLMILVVMIVVFMVVAIRKTLASMRREYGPAPGRHTMQEAIEELQSENVLCPRCGRQTFRMLDHDGYRKCDTCHHVFQHPVNTIV